MPASLLLSTVFYTSLYFSFADCFAARDAAEPSHPTKASHEQHLPRRPRHRRRQQHRPRLRPRLHAAGYHVVLAGRRLDALEQTIAQAGTGSAAQLLAVPTDVGDPASVKALLPRPRSLRPPRLLFNNAGMGAPAVPMES